MSAPRVEIHIEELLLHGFRPGDRHRIAAALRGEMERLLADGRAPFHPSSTASLDVGEVRLEPNAPPRQVGRDVARAIVGGLER